MGSAEARITALEEQIARLESRLAGDPRPAPPAYDRRALLRRGGAVLAGAAGALAVPGLAGTAAAANGDPLTVGGTFAGTTPTTLVNNHTSGPRQALVAKSTGLFDGAAGAPLQVFPGAAPLNYETSQSGDLFTDPGGGGVPPTLTFTHDGATSADVAGVGTVYTDYLANVYVPMRRDLPRAVNRVRLTAGQTLTVNSDVYFEPGAYVVGLVATFTAIDTTGVGYATLNAFGDPPTNPCLQWSAAGQRVCTQVIVPPRPDGKLSIWVAGTCTVYLFITGAFVPSPAHVKASSMQSMTAAARTPAARQAAARQRWGSVR
jgi:hypothetical protein